MKHSRRVQEGGKNRKMICALSNRSLQLFVQVKCFMFDVIGRKLKKTDVIERNAPLLSSKSCHDFMRAATARAICFMVLYYLNLALN